MPRIARIVAPGYPHHITQRGNRRQSTFFLDDDYAAYIDLMAEWCRHCGMEGWAYCLMPNLEAAKMIKQVLGDTPLFLVGGMRTVAQMEDILENEHADVISMSRPFIREPFLVKKIEEGKMEKVSCVSCNRCLAAVVNGIPVYCYNKGFPKKNKNNEATYGGG